MNTPGDGALKKTNRQMPKLSTSDKIYLAPSTIEGGGRGVFAKKNISEGEVIEDCPIIEIPNGDTANLTETILITYFFYFGKNKNRVALALGFGSLYNHSYKPNAKFKILPTKKVIRFTALKNIKKDTEITFNYRGESVTQTPLWFE